MSRCMWWTIWTSTPCSADCSASSNLRTWSCKSAPFKTQASRNSLEAKPSSPASNSQKPPFWPGYVAAGRPLLAPSPFKKPHALPIHFLNKIKKLRGTATRACDSSRGAGALFYSPGRNAPLPHIANPHCLRGHAFSNNQSLHFYLVLLIFEGNRSLQIKELQEEKLVYMTISPPIYVISKKKPLIQNVIQTFSVLCSWSIYN